MSSTSPFSQKWNRISLKHTAQRNAVHRMSVDGSIIQHGVGFVPDASGKSSGKTQQTMSSAEGDSYAQRVLGLRKQIDREIGATKREAQTFLPAKSSFGFDKGPRQAYIDKFNEHPKAAVYHGMYSKLGRLSGDTHKFTYDGEGLHEETLVEKVLDILSTDR